VITTDNLVTATLETGLTATVENNLENPETTEGAAEALALALVPEVPSTGGELGKMGVLLSSNKVYVSTATRKVTSGITVPNYRAAPEKEVWTDGEIIEIIAPAEVAEEAETAEATLLDNSPEAGPLVLHTKQEEEVTESIKPQVAGTKVTTTDKRRAGEGISVLNRDLDRPGEDATSIRAMRENECDDYTLG
jgi:hypothetical protein